jgi:hypothetical protein
MDIMEVFMKNIKELNVLMEDINSQISDSDIPDKKVINI